MLSHVSLDDIRTLYMSLPIAACLIDRALNFVAVNQMYATLMQQPLVRIIGGNMAQVNPQMHIDNVQRDFSTFDSGQTVPDHEIVVRDQILLVSVSPFRRSGEAGVSAISVTLQNITARKKAETQLSIAHQQLLDSKRHIEQLAYTDALTGLPNRRGFDAALERELAISRRHGTPLALALADIDAFKQFNDLYGHVAGDECLARVAQAIGQGARRPGDYSARYGGEEFVIIVPHTHLEGAIALMQTLRRDIEALGMLHAGHPAGVLTCSFGVAAMHRVPVDMDNKLARERLLEQADAALYRAKAAGRNRVLGIQVEA